MTTRNGSYALQGLRGSAPKRGSWTGNFTGAIVVTPPTKLYKNQGWYVAGSVWEAWITPNTPNATPPSGHTLTELSYVVLP